jgi:predicted GNAT family N-acyltransferase
MRRNALEGFVFKVPNDSERRAALAMRSRIYATELGSAGLDHFDAAAHHVVAVTPDARVIATVRIIGPEQRPFDIESLFNLSAVLPPNRVPAEISRFCVDPGHRQMHRRHMLHFGMLKAVYDLATKLNITDIVTLGLPHLKNLYRIGYFSEMGGACVHPVWGPAHPMRLDLVELRRRYASSSNGLASLLLSGAHPNVRV